MSSGSYKVSGSFSKSCTKGALTGLSNYKLREQLQDTQNILKSKHKHFKIAFFKKKVKLITVRMGYKNLAHKDDVIASPGKSIGVGSGVGAGGGALIGFFMGGPVGAALGAHLGATTGFVTSGVTHAVHSEKGVHEYVLFEWGQKLKKPSGSFNYEYYLRLDFTINGYEIFCGPTDEYWQTWPFNDEKSNHQGHTASVYTLEKDGVAKLIKLIQGHDSKYVAATNNCKDFARKVYNAMN